MTLETLVTSILAQNYVYYAVTCKKGFLNLKIKMALYTNI